MQIHGAADVTPATDATTVATLYSSATASTSRPAVTLRSVGSAGGQAAAFTYDLARSIVATRQGNIAWAGQKRDGEINPIRSDDLFFPDWLDFSKVRIPQADEQQRLLANLITQMNLDRTPLPRFWYLPRGEKAAVVLTGDDHGHAGTIGQFNRYEQASPAGCSVADWQCVRSTSYVYPGTDITAAQAQAFQAAGFEIALHLSTDCADFTPASLEDDWETQLPEFADICPSLVRPADQPDALHRLERLGQRAEGRAHARRPPRRQLLLLARGLGPGPARHVHRVGLPDALRRRRRLADRRLPGGDAAHRRVGASTSTATSRRCSTAPWAPTATTASSRPTCTPTTTTHPGADDIVAEAQARGVPVVSAVQMLDWLDGRNDSSFGDLSYDGEPAALQRGPAPERAAWRR